MSTLKQHRMSGFFKTALILLIPVLTLIVAQHAKAQESTQIIITGVPPILSSPFYEDLLDDYDRGLYQLQFIYTAPGNTPRSFRFRVTVTRDGATLANVVSDPVSFEPGVYFLDDFFRDTNFPTSVSEILDNFTTEFKSQLIQTGALPEGSYSIRFEANPVQQQPLLSVIPGFVNAAVRLPQPPVLVTPPDQANVLISVPVFTWTPVVAVGGLSVEYEFLMVELIDGQNPDDAMVSNPPHHEQILLQNTLPYTPDLFPLENGRQYAWQITARDAAGQIPFASGGRSEVYTFTFGQTQEDDDSPAGIEAPIALVPGLLELTDLEFLDAINDGVNILLNGNATAELSMAGLSTSEVPVFVNNLRVAGAGTGIPIILGGSVELDEFTMNQLLENRLPARTSLTDIQWSLATGLRSRMLLDLPGMATNEADGFITLTNGGLAGMAQLTGSPLVFAEDDYLQLNLNTVSVNAASGMMSGSGSISILGRDSGCTLNNLMSNGDVLSGTFNCQDSFSIPMVANSPRLAVDVTRIHGSAGFNLESGDLQYDLTMPGRIGILTANGNYCGSNVNIALQHQSGISTQQTGGYFCPEAQPAIDLGFASLILNQTSVESISYDPGSDSWDFSMTLNAALRVPAFDNWTSSTLSDIILNKDGIEFPFIDFNMMVTPLPEFNADRLRAKLNLFRINEFLFPLYSWDGLAPGPWDMSFSGNATVRSTPGMPPCLIGQQLNMSQNTINQNVISAPLLPRNIHNCEWNISESLALNINGLSANLGIRYLVDGSFEKFGEINPAGVVNLKAPFTCGSGQAITFSGEQLEITNGINGSFEGVASNCTAQIGSFSADITNADIFFDRADGSPQEAIMEADAVLNLANGQTVNGSFAFDFMTNSYTDVDFEISNAFDWYYMSGTNPLLEFRIGSAEITNAGIFVNGRHHQIIENQQRGVTFDNVVIDLATSRMRSGRILFDDTFNMQVSFSSGFDQPEFLVVSDNHTLTENPGLLFMLGESVQADSLGIQISGESAGSLLYSGTDYRDQITAVFSSGARIGSAEQGVSSGQITFNHNNLPVAILNDNGFNPLEALSTGILFPERLNLPFDDVAYIQLRDDDTHFVQVEPTSEGNIRIRALEDVSASLVITYFDTSNPIILTDLSFEDFVISATPENPEILGGRIRAVVDGQNSMADLRSYNVPFHLKNVIFDERVISGQNQFTLTFEGDYYLFDERISGEQSLEMSVRRNDKRLFANYTDVPVNGVLPLLSDHVQMNVETIRGGFNMIKGASNHGFNFQLSGGMEVLTDDGYIQGAELRMVARQNNFGQLQQAVPMMFDEQYAVTVGETTFNVSGVTSVSGFSFSQQDGIQLNVGLVGEIGLPVGETVYEIPLTQLEMRKAGILIGTQDIDETTVPGFNLPFTVVEGYELRPLQISIPESFTMLWNSDGNIPDGAINMDIILNLPPFLRNSALNPPDGLLARNLTYQNGLLSGEIDFFEPINGVEIPIHPDFEETTLLATSISGSLSVYESNMQAFSLFVEGQTGSFGAFSEEFIGSCPDSAPFNLNIHPETGYLLGTISDVVPCGRLHFGIFDIQTRNGELTLEIENENPVATFVAQTDLFLVNGQVSAQSLAEGSHTFNLLTGEHLSGVTDISTQFTIGMQRNVENPFISLQTSQAQFRGATVTFDGNGMLTSGSLNRPVEYNSLIINTESLAIQGGSAASNGALVFERLLNPVAVSLKDSDSPVAENNTLHINFTGPLAISENGLTFGDIASSEIIFDSRDYPNLNSSVSDDFAFRMNGSAVRSGSIDFYEDGDDVTVAEPLVVFSTSGFFLNEDPNRVLPVRLLLPSTDIAYITVRDEDNNPLVNAEYVDGVVVVSSGNNFLTMTLPSILVDGLPLQLPVRFSLNTDITYSITGGEIEMQSGLNFSEITGGLPITLTGFDLDYSDGLALLAKLRLSLPHVFNDFTDTFDVPVTPSGLQASTIVLGDMNPQLIEGIQTLSNKRAQDSASQNQTADFFDAGMTGLRLVLGSEHSARLAGYASSSLFGIGSADVPLYFTANWEGSVWDFSHRSFGSNQVLIGDATLNPDGEAPVSFTSNENTFYVSFKGVLSYSEIIGEEFLFTAENISAGIQALRTNPSIRFTASGSGSSSDQIVGLFGNVVELELESPSLTVEERAVTVSSSGNIKYLGHDVPFTDFSLSTNGSFSFPRVEIDRTANLEIIGENVTLHQIELKLLETGLEFNVEYLTHLPDPFEELETSFALNQQISRNEDGAIVVNEVGMRTTFPSYRAYSVLSGFGVASLGSLHLELNPFQPTTRTLNINMAIYLPDADADPAADETESFLSGNYNAALFLGNADTPGIRINRRADGSVSKVYNLTGNAAFSMRSGFFNVAVGEDTATMPALASTFRITIAGMAELNIPGISGSIQIQDVLVDKTGTINPGLMTGSANLDIIGVLDASISSFTYYKPSSPFSITFSDIQEKAPAELAQLMEDGATAIPQVSIDNVVEILCIGSCPAQIQNAPNSGTSPVGATVTFNLPTNGVTGSTEVEEMYFYRTSDGKSFANVKGLEIQADELITVRMDIGYEGTTSGTPVLHGGGMGTIHTADLSDVDLMATLRSGKLRSGDDSNGFVMSFGARPGVPISIKKDVLYLNGFAGSVMYKPDVKGINLVLDYMGEFGYQLVNANAFGELNFNSNVTVTLVGEFGIGPTGNVGNQFRRGEFLLSATGLIAASNTGFYLDGRADALQGKMEGAGAEAKANIMAGFGRIPGSTSILFELDLQYRVPFLIEATGLIDFFYSSRDDGVRWGLIGNVHLNKFNGSFDGEGLLLASNDGFLFELNLATRSGFSIISFRSNLSGSLWVLDSSIYSMPWGAYVRVAARAQLLIVTISAEARGALVGTGSGFELFCSVRGCARVFLPLITLEACGSAWIKISNSGFRAGLGSGGNSDLIAQAREQRDQFLTRIESIRTQMAEVQQALADAEALANEQKLFELTQALLPSDEDVRAAGSYLYLMNLEKRQQWATAMRTNEELNGTQIPPSLSFVLDEILTKYNQPEMTGDLSPEQQLEILNASLTTAGDILDSFADFDDSIITAMQLLEYSEEIFNQLEAAFASSPISNIVAPSPSLNPTASVSFMIDQNRAGSQIAALEGLDEELMALDQRFRDNIEAVEVNLSEVKRLMISSDSDTPLMTLVRPFKNTIEHLERYYALNANKIWSRIIWANSLRNSLVSNQTAILNSGLAQLESNYIQPVIRLQSPPTNQFFDPIAEVNKIYWETFKLTQRDYFIQLLKTNQDFPGSNAVLWGGIGLQAGVSSPNQGNIHPEDNYKLSRSRDIYNIYRTISDSLSNEVRTQNIAVYNRSLWYDMHYNGLLFYEENQLELLDRVLNQMTEARQGILPDMANLTGLFDEFYSIQSSLTAILWNMNNGYVDWRGTFEDSSEMFADAPPVSQYTDRIQQLSNELIPPQIGNLSVVTNTISNAFFTPVDIQWTVSHPVEVTEIAIQYDLTGGNTNTGILDSQDDYITLGMPESNTGSIRLNPFLGIENRNGLTYDTVNPQIDFGLRVRGAAGNTAIRRGVATISFSANLIAGNYIDTPPVTTPNETGMNPGNPQPPQQPSIQMFESVGITEDDGAVTYWTSNPGFIQLIIDGYDPIFGISKYEVAIGTSPGETDVMNWSEVQGTRTTLPEIPAQRINAHLSFQAMEEAVPYFISARVINTQNLTSAPFAMQEPIIYDNVEPGLPEAVYVPSARPLNQVTHSGLAPFNRSNQTPSPTCYDPDQTFTTLTFPAVLSFRDAEATPPPSRIHSFEYYISRSDQVQHSRFDSGDFDTVLYGNNFSFQSDVEDPEFNNFRTPMYLHIRAVSNSFKRGQTSVIGPFIPVDTSKPYAGSWGVVRHVYNHQDPYLHSELRLFIECYPYDPEVDLRGIQYSITHRNTATGVERVIREFRTDGQPDRMWNQQLYNNIPNPGWNPSPIFARIPIRNNPDGTPNLPQGYDDEVTVWYRSINTRGDVSDTYGVGPIRLVKATIEITEAKRNGSDIEVVLQANIGSTTTINSIVFNSEVEYSNVQVPSTFVTQVFRNGAYSQTNVNNMLSVGNPGCTNQWGIIVCDNFFQGGQITVANDNWVADLRLRMGRIPEFHHGKMTFRDVVGNPTSITIHYTAHDGSSRTATATIQ